MLFEIGLSCSYYEKHEKSFFDKIACKIASANQQIEKINVVLEEIKLGLVQITLLQFFRIHFFLPMLYNQWKLLCLPRCWEGKSRIATIEARQFIFKDDFLCTKEISR